MKVIIAGSRNIENALKEVCLAVVNSPFSSISEIVSGTARGVDVAGEAFAYASDIPIVTFTPDWDIYGKSAGIRRNMDMGKYADALIAIWDGKSKGTKHMIDFMNTLNKPIYIHMVKENG